MMPSLRRVMEPTCLCDSLTTLTGGLAHRNVEAEAGGRWGRYRGV